MRRILRFILLKVIAFLYWLDSKMPNPGNLGSDIYSWLERHHMCCSIHGWKGKD